MRVSELAERSGVPIATIKFYIREGMLPRGAASGATRAEYGDEHVARLRLIAALTQVAGLPLARVREVLEVVDTPPADPVAAIGRAIGALPPYVDDDGDLSRAKAAIEALGLTFDPRFAAVAQLESAIRALEAAGLPSDPQTLRRYGDAMARVAAEEVAPVDGMITADAVEYAVLGTALYEPVMLALRRLAHQHRLVAERRD
jgi:DNA-binding transcriptional MerR regulator